MSISPKSNLNPVLKNQKNYSKQTYVLEKQKVYKNTFFNYATNLK